MLSSCKNLIFNISYANVEKYTQFFQFWYKQGINFDKWQLNRTPIKQDFIKGK